MSCVVLHVGERCMVILLPFDNCTSMILVLAVYLPVLYLLLQSVMSKDGIDFSLKNPEKIQETPTVEGCTYLHFIHRPGFFLICFFFLIGFSEKGEKNEISCFLIRDSPNKNGFPIVQNLISAQQLFPFIKCLMFCFDRGFPLSWYL